MADFGFGGQKNKQDWMRILFFFMLGLFLILYLFSDAIQKQGIPTDISMLMFIVIIAVSLWILIFIVSTLSPKRQLDKEDWLIVIIAAVGVIALLIFFPGVVPESFKGAVANMQSMLGM